MSCQFSRWNTSGILLLTCLVCLTGCSSTHPVPKMPQPAAPLIPVDGEAIPALTFAELILDIPHQVPIGYRYEGLEYIRGDEIRWSEHFGAQTDVLNQDSRTVLTEAGYRVSEDDPRALRLVGTMSRVSFNSYAAKVSFDQAECQMTWQLYRDGAEAPYFTTVTHGAGRVDAKKMGAIRAAFELALRRLLANPDFVAAVSE
ncbi:MAG: hypothetical protein QNL91_07490 [Candidatus Krumholzibacteria bacterium]|nr:hypothetical protein [Candidatus Krumholzibacteria bacterium]